MSDSVINDETGRVFAQKVNAALILGEKINEVLTDEPFDISVVAMMLLLCGATFEKVNNRKEAMELLHQGLDIVADICDALEASAKKEETDVQAD